MLRNVHWFISSRLWSTLVDNRCTTQPSSKTISQKSMLFYMCYSGTCRRKDCVISASVWRVICLKAHAKGTPGHTEHLVDDTHKSHDIENTADYAHMTSRTPSILWAPQDIWLMDKHTTQQMTPGTRDIWLMDKHTTQQMTQEHKTSDWWTNTQPSRWLRNTRHLTDGQTHNPADDSGNTRHLTDGQTHNPADDSGTQDIWLMDKHTTQQMTQEHKTSDWWTNTQPSRWLRNTRHLTDGQTHNPADDSGTQDIWLMDKHTTQQMTPGTRDIWLMDKHTTQQMTQEHKTSDWWTNTQPSRWLRNTRHLTDGQTHNPADDSGTQDIWLMDKHTTQQMTQEHKTSDWWTNTQPSRWLRNTRHLTDGQTHNPADDSGTQDIWLMDKHTTQQMTQEHKTSDWWTNTQPSRWLRNTRHLTDGQTHNPADDSGTQDIWLMDKHTTQQMTQEHKTSDWWTNTQSSRWLREHKTSDWWTNTQPSRWLRDTRHLTDGQTHNPADDSGTQDIWLMDKHTTQQMTPGTQDIWLMDKHTTQQMTQEHKTSDWWTNTQPSRWLRNTRHLTDGQTHNPADDSGNTRHLTDGQTHNPADDSGNTRQTDRWAGALKYIQLYLIDVINIVNNEWGETRDMETSLWRHLYLEDTLLGTQQVSASHKSQFQMILF